MKFQQFIKYLIESESYRLTDLAKKTKIHSSDLSKIVNGKRACGPKTLGLLLEGMDEKHQGQGLVMWLRDQIPAQFLHRVHVVQSDAPSIKREETPDIRTIEGAVSLLSAQAESNEALRAVLLSMAKAFTPPS